MDSQTSMLELQTQLWRARAQAKQKRLERTLARPTGSAEEAALRMAWITRVLKAVKRGQAELKYHAALLDTYSQHLSVLEMTLLAAREEKRSAGGKERQTRVPERQQV